MALQKLRTLTALQLSDHILPGRICRTTIDPSGYHHDRSTAAPIHQGSITMETSTYNGQQPSGNGSTRKSRIAYNWGGSTILQMTAVGGTRQAVTHDGERKTVTMDIREWITPATRWEIKTTTNSLIEKWGLPLPTERGSGLFDRRALVCWSFVVEQIKYVREDDPTQSDLWQFPAETLALQTGDCEDCAFLLGTLLLASGISPFCVRVVFGTLKQQDMPDEPHALPCYLDEAGRWRALESTLFKEEMPSWQLDDKLGPLADDLAAGSALDRVQGTFLPIFLPDYGVTEDHVWEIARHQ
jgi:hypothetical protein